MSQEEEPPSRKSQSWKEVVYNRLKERNQRESLPFRHIYQHHQRLLQSYVQLEAQRDGAKHALKLLEYETADMMSRKDSDAKAVVAFCRQQVGIVHRDLSTPSASPHENLSKTVYEQKKIIAHQVEEMSIAKSELRNALAELAVLRSEYEPAQQRLAAQEHQLTELKSMMQSMEELVSELKKENNSLTERLIAEKEQSARQMNDINTLMEGKPTSP